ncbi:UDP-N-acetylglucosamine transferase subunit ALG14 homolog isoform X2 [Protopterus annectens]|uniref:UDP-N-acetylglucosamine transferase subunit ALG14 homolog isoform X2 n=1 Tax=Protopterus annectens TaxID=7888 RepID=UPI001CFC1239|nr:UDP-N-acetylglucosamine transferase subunit ALG14 homolog isoform X2 [Protopterus annectens]
MDFQLLVLTFCVLLVVLLARLLIILRTRDCKPGRKGFVSVLAVAGSGGHTTELLRLLGSLSSSYTPRYYVIADTDKMSEDKITTFESTKGKKTSEAQFTIHRIPRSREVLQSWSSSVLTTLYSFFYSLPLVFRLKPDLMSG